jgi:hypothetical protein
VGNSEKILPRLFDAVAHNTAFGNEKRPRDESLGAVSFPIPRGLDARHQRPEDRFGVVLGARANHPRQSERAKPSRRMGVSSEK